MVQTTNNNKIKVDDTLRDMELEMNTNCESDNNNNKSCSTMMIPSNAETTESYKLVSMVQNSNGKEKIIIIKDTNLSYKVDSDKKNNDTPLPDIQVDTEEAYPSTSTNLDIDTTESNGCKNIIK